MNKKNFSFQLGNRGLSVKETPMVEVVNQALQTSAAKHGKILNDSAKFVVTAKMSANGRILRASTDKK